MTGRVRTFFESVFDFTLDSKKRERFFDIVFLVGVLTCLPVGAFPQYSGILSILLLGCIAISFFDDNFYLYTALFMFMRYKMMLGDTPAYRFYSYLVVLKFVLDLSKVKLRAVYFPAIFVFVLHSIFALGVQFNLPLGIYVIADIVIVYAVILKVLSDPKLTRKFFLAFLLGGVTSGVYGWTNADVSVDINVRGAGQETVNRNFGALGDANFAGLYYCTCTYIALILKNIPKWVKAVFLSIFIVLILQTASLSALLTLAGLGVVFIILKFRGKSIFILFFSLVITVAVLGVLLSIPQFREIPAIAGLLIRFAEKISYITMGNLDLLTTGRADLWENALNVFSDKSIWGKLFGGSVITIMHIDEKLAHAACHQSIIQSLLNFGVVGTLLIYLPFIGVLISRVFRHLCTPAGYDTEDIAILRIMMPVAFLIFGMSVDFFIDWTYLFFYFI